jgi:5'-phosphate synthase pdxT subunit
VTAVPRTTVGVLAVQGAFIEHERRLKRLGARCVELRQARDLEQGFDRLVLPGGESTVQTKLLRDLGMLEPLRRRVADGMPVLATCAGLILLAEQVEGQGAGCFGTLSVTVRRNAYGRQLGSFHTCAPLALGLRAEKTATGAPEPPCVPMTFIRAPVVTEVRGAAQVLARVDGAVVAVRQGGQIGLAFHPELDDDTRVHEAFLEL